MRLLLRPPTSRPCRLSMLIKPAIAIHQRAMTASKNRAGTACACVPPPCWASGAARNSRRQQIRAMGASHAVGARKNAVFYCSGIHTALAAVRRRQIECPRFAYISVSCLSVSLRLFWAFCLVCSQTRRYPFFANLCPRHGELPGSFHHFGGGAPPTRSLSCRRQN